MEYDNTKYLLWKIFQSKTILKKMIGKTLAMYKGMNKSKKSIKIPLSTVPNLHINCHLKHEPITMLVCKS